MTIFWRRRPPRASMPPRSRRPGRSAPGTQASPACRMDGTSEFRSRPHRHPVRTVRLAGLFGCTRAVEGSPAAGGRVQSAEGETPGRAGRIPLTGAPVRYRAFLARGCPHAHRWFELLLHRQDTGCKLSAARMKTPLNAMFCGVFRVNLLTSHTQQMSYLRS